MFEIYIYPCCMHYKTTSDSDMEEEWDRERERERERMGASGF